jgi:hypothetical protein
MAEARTPQEIEKAPLTGLAFGLPFARGREVARMTQTSENSCHHLPSRFPGSILPRAAKMGRLISPPYLEYTQRITEPLVSERAPLGRSQPCHQPECVRNLCSNAGESIARGLTLVEVVR